MFGLGFTELLFLAVLGLILIGPKQLPEIARTLGRFLNELKRTTDSFKTDLSTMASSEIRRSEQKPKADAKAEENTPIAKGANAAPAPIEELPPHKPDGPLESNSDDNNGDSKA